MKCFFILLISAFFIFNALMNAKQNNNSKDVPIIDFYDSSWVADTIDFSPARVFLSVPEFSLNHSRDQIIEGHGESIYYPLKYTLDKNGNWDIQVLFIEHIVMYTYDRMIYNDSIDIELWNTFNSSSRGSRAYVCNGLYTRIDLLEGGISVFYENLTPQMADIANRIIKSIVITTDRNVPVFKERKKVHSI